MAINIPNFTPFIPSEAALIKDGLPDKAVALINESAQLAGLPPETRRVITEHMAVINSYYSNLIEGNRTQPHEIRQAQQGDFSEHPAKRDLQMESVAHIQVQQWLEKQALNVDDLFSVECIQAIHQEFYQHVPDSLKVLKNDQGAIIDKVIPGQWRKRAVTVGRHMPPDAERVPSLMQQFLEAYHPRQYSGDKKIIAVMCAHHRFAWIHPFTDGNGRVGRLFTDAALKAVGIKSTGVWSLSRGLARSSDRYKQLLERADFPRQGDFDGRGALSEKNLLEFCEYLLDTALDQVRYISSLLALDSMHTRIKKYIQARNDLRVPGLDPIKNVAGVILYNAFVSGKLERSMALELTGMPDRSARRLIAQLKNEGLLTETSSRSPLYWQIPEHAEPWYLPQLTPGILI
jgi:Fic family protein